MNLHTVDAPLAPAPLPPLHVEVRFGAVVLPTALAVGVVALDLYDTGLNPAEAQKAIDTMKGRYAALPAPPPAPPVPVPNPTPTPVTWTQVGSTVSQLSADGKTRVDTSVFVQK